MIWREPGETFDAGDRTLRLALPPIFDGPTTRGLLDVSTGAMWAVDSFAALAPDAHTHRVEEVPQAMYDETSTSSTASSRRGTSGWTRPSTTRTSTAWSHCARTSSPPRTAPCFRGWRSTTPSTGFAVSPERPSSRVRGSWCSTRCSRPPWRWADGHGRDHGDVHPPVLSAVRHPGRRSTSVPWRAPEAPGASNRETPAPVLTLAADVV